MVTTAINTRLLFEDNQDGAELPNPKVARLISVVTGRAKSEESLKQACNIIGHHTGCWFKPRSEQCNGSTIIVAIPAPHDATGQKARLYEISLCEFSQAAYAVMADCAECAQEYYEIDVDEITGLPALDDKGLPNLTDLMEYRTSE